VAVALQHLDAALHRCIAEPIRVEDLRRNGPYEPARRLSTFISKRVTAMSPLQYQKRLRLLEARRLLVVGGNRVHIRVWKKDLVSAP
jgi:AraC-like DNA-binding protein